MKYKLLLIALFVFGIGWGQVSLPFSYDLGKPTSVNGLVNTGLGSDYSSSPKMKFDTTSDNLILNFIGIPNALSFDIKWNQSSASSRFPGDFQVSESADGINYNILQMYNSTSGTALPNGQVISQIFSSLNTTTRYIKWEYTNKTNAIWKVKPSMAELCVVSSPAHG